MIRINPCSYFKLLGFVNRYIYMEKRYFKVIWSKFEDIYKNGTYEIIAFKDAPEFSQKNNFIPYVFCILKSTILNCDFKKYHIKLWLLFNLSCSFNKTTFSVIVHKFITKQANWPYQVIWYMMAFFRVKKLKVRWPTINNPQ